MDGWVFTSYARLARYTAPRCGVPRNPLPRNPLSIASRPRSARCSTPTTAPTTRSSTRSSGATWAGSRWPLPTRGRRLNPFRSIYLSLYLISKVSSVSESNRPCTLYITQHPKLGRARGGPRSPVSRQTAHSVRNQRGTRATVEEPRANPEIIPPLSDRLAVIVNDIGTW